MTRHTISDRFTERFRAEHAEICDRLLPIVNSNPHHETLEKLWRFFVKTKRALHFHRYRVVEWKRRLEKFQHLYSEEPAVQSCIRELIRLLSDVLTETKGQN